MHKQIGPGLLESAYHSCLTREFTLNALRFSRDVSVPILYKGSTVDCAYRADFVVEDELLLELKSVDRMQPIHQAQLLTYLRLLKLRQGLLINFNVSRLVEGVRSQLL